MSAIQATSRNMRTMADGTLRLTVDVEPRYAQDAFKLFGAPDVPMALAALTPQAAQATAQAEIIEAAKPKTGRLSQWAAMRCNDEEFFKFIAPIYDIYMGYNGTGYGDILPEDVGGIPEYCRHAILVMCEIESRAELDTNEQAKEKFDRLIRLPYSEHIKHLKNESSHFERS